MCNPYFLTKLLGSFIIRIIVVFFIVWKILYVEIYWNFKYFIKKYEKYLTLFNINIYQN